VSHGKWRTYSAPPAEPSKTNWLSTNSAFSASVSAMTRRYQHAPDASIALVGAMPGPERLLRSAGVGSERTTVGKCDGTAVRSFKRDAAVLAYDPRRLVRLVWHQHILWCARSSHPGAVFSTGKDAAPTS